MASRPRVLIDVTCYPAWVHKRVVFALLRMAADPRVEARIQLVTRRPYVSALNATARNVLDGGWDYWIHVDADNPPEQANPLDLVFLDLDVVGCPTPVWHYDRDKPRDRHWYENALVRAPGGWRPLQDTAPGFDGAGLWEVDAIGSGCMVVARRVLEALPAPFARTFDANGVADVGADYRFCERAQGAGFRIWAHFGYRCDHYNELSLREVIA